MKTAQALIEQVTQGKDPRAVLREDNYEDQVRGLNLQMRMAQEEITYFRRQLALRKQNYQNLQKELATLRSRQGALPHKV